MNSSVIGKFAEDAVNFLFHHFRGGFDAFSAALGAVVKVVHNVAALALGHALHARVGGDARHPRDIGIVAARCGVFGLRRHRAARHSLHGPMGSNRLYPGARDCRNMLQPRNRRAFRYLGCSKQ